MARRRRESARRTARVAAAVVALVAGAASARAGGAAHTKGASATRGAAAPAAGGAGHTKGASAARGAAAPAGHVVDRDNDGVVVDWTRGMIVARAAAAADLRARSPQVARVGAERRARARAREALRRRAGKLRLADGGRAGRALARRRARDVLHRALQHSLDVGVDYGSDGSVVMREGLPLEAVRAAVWRAPAPPPGAPGSVTAVVVDAGGVLHRPRLGIALSAGSVRYRGPVVYRYGSAGDGRLGARVLRARARRLSHGALVLSGEHGNPFPPARLSAARNCGALVVILIEKAHR